ncbi:AAA family ATPase [bacterium]|nr:AAA family ATPase [bacterium]
MLNEVLWVEKYRPRTVTECILPQELKNTFQSIVNNGTIPNLLLTGTQGTGKTTVARALCEQVDSDYIIINGSMNGGIDTLRNEIQQFASTVSFMGGRKMVILDEADYLNAQSTQPALRNFMEEFSKNCGFILTCNFKSRIIEPLHSRCSIVEFKIPPKEKPGLAGQFYKRVLTILDSEGIEYNKNVVGELIARHFPDWRRVINELQRYSVSGKIDTGILVNLSDEHFTQLVTILKDRRFNDMRKWVAESNDIEPSVLFRKIYDALNVLVKPTSIPQAILILAEYQYKAAFVADQEINLVACLSQLMAEVEYV